MFGHSPWRKIRRGWLRPWITSIIGHSPKNGAEIMDAIEKNSWGSWRPSPGSVYPLLEEMVQEGAIHKMEDGRYELTEKGKEESDWSFGMPFRQGPYSVENMLGEMKSYVSYLEDLSKSDPAKLKNYGDRIKVIADRLVRLETT
ncbi:MAG: PadR family transcriptional regulator [Nitrososphaerales archaeon]